MELTFTNLLIIVAIGFAAPLGLGFVPSVRVPSVVIEIVLGIVVGPAVLGWVHVDDPVQVFATVGLAYLLFLAGLEIDFERLRGRVLRLALLGFAVSLITGGRLGDIYGRKRVFLWGLSSFTLASVLCGLAVVFAIYRLTILNHSFLAIRTGARTAIARRHPPGSRAAGRLRRNNAPPPSAFSAVMSPPWARTRPRAIERPRPDLGAASPRVRAYSAL